MAVALAGCGTRADEEAITALVGRLMEVLAPGGAPSGSANPADIFFGLDDVAAGSLPAGLASAVGIRSHTVRGVRILPFGRAAVTVDVRGEAAAGTLELRARKSHGQWRLDPSIRLKQTLDEVKRTDP